MGIVCGLVSWGYWCVCVCVAVSSWVCRSNVSRFVLLVRSGVWGLVPRCMYQSGWGFFLRVGALGVTWVGYCCWRTGQYRGWVALIQFFLSSTCFEYLVFIIRKNICTGRFFNSMFFTYLCKQSSRWKKNLNVRTSGLPDDKYTMSETWRRPRRIELKH